MLTWQVIFLFLCIYQNSIQAAVPIDIVTEKSTAERLAQKFPFIIPMIPDKEPLLSARREKEPLAEPFFFLEKTRQAPGNLSISQNVTVSLTTAWSQTTSVTEILNTKLQNQTATTSATRKETLKAQTPKTSSDYSTSQDMVAKEKPVSQTRKKQQHRSSSKMSRKKRLFSQRRRMFEHKQRQKRSATYAQQQIKSDNVLLKLHKTFDKDPLMVSQNIDQKHINVRELTGQEEISAEENMLRRNRYGKYGNNAWWDSRYQVWQYDSGYVDYDIPFPMAGYKPVHKQKGVAQGVEIAVAQVYPILKSMVLGKSSLTKRPNKIFP